MRGRCSIFGLRIIVAMVSWFWTIPVFAQDLIQGPKPLLLLQPLGNTRSIAPSGGLTMFYQYFNSSFPWLIGVAAGIAVLQTLRGGDFDPSLRRRSREALGRNIDNDM